MPESDLSLLVSAARQAGQIAQGYFQRDPEVIDKPDGAGPVTAADLAVNAMLEDRLRAARPDYGWLSEETEDTGARLTTRRQFVIDPIDGTRAFIEGSKDWAHSLAVVEDGVPVAAAVYVPMRDLMFSAALDAPAAMNGERLTAATGDRVPAVVLASKANFDSRHWRGGKLPDITRAFRSSLAYRLCLVAKGRFDAMLTLRPSWEWDIAAGALIAGQAGAVVTDQHGAALRFNNPQPLVPGVVAGGPALHQRLVGHLEAPAPSA